jgi:hypothetical protein
MLMVTTTEGMVNWIHTYGAYAWPAVSLGLVLPVGSSSLQDWFIDTTTASNNT